MTDYRTTPEAARERLQVAKLGAQLDAATQQAEQVAHDVSQALWAAREVTDKARACLRQLRDPDLAPAVQEVGDFSGGDDPIDRGVAQLGAIVQRLESALRSASALYFKEYV